MASARSDFDRLQHLRSLAWLLDNSISLPGGYRIGVDALLGVVPGMGDVIGAMISAYIINEARALGAPRTVLLRMTANVATEAVIGCIPLVGDLFDAAYKANSRNLLLLERHQSDPKQSIRASRIFMVGYSLLFGSFVALIVAITILVVLAIVKLV